MRSASGAALLVTPVATKCMCRWPTRELSEQRHRSNRKKTFVAALSCRLWGCGGGLSAKARQHSGTGVHCCAAEGVLQGCAGKRSPPPCCRNMLVSELSQAWAALGPSGALVLQQLHVRMWSQRGRHAQVCAVTRGGGFAEEVVVRDGAALRLPPGADVAAAAGAALRRARSRGALECARETACGRAGCHERVCASSARRGLPWPVMRVQPAGGCEAHVRAGKAAGPCAGQPKGSVPRGSVPRGSVGAARFALLILR